MIKIRTKVTLQAGFSLIEMLVVITVSAVLCALTMTALRGARQSARNAVCQSNLRTFATAITSYRAAHNDYLPLATTTVDLRSSQLAPLDALTQYLSVPLPSVGPDQVIIGGQPFACPADQRDFAEHGFSYLYLPMTAMSSIASMHGAQDTPRLYARLLADRTDEEFLTDFRFYHQGKRNVLMSTNAIHTK